MHKQLLYEYAVMRMVPRVEREEFINVGIILFCKENNYLQSKSYLNLEKLRCLDPLTDVEMALENLKMFELIAIAGNCRSAIAKMDAPSRFRWLTATRSTIIQCSKVHPGLCMSLDANWRNYLEVWYCSF